MEEWKEYQIADICKIKHGFAFKGQYFTDCKQPYVCITPGNFAIKGGFKLNKPKYYNGPIPENYILHANDLIITMTDLSKEGDTLGYSALVPQSSDYIFLHNQRIGLVEEINDKIDKHFLYWIMRTYDYQKYIVKHCSGSTVKHTSPNNIGSYFFKAPSLKKQKDIASILDNFEAKIELNRRINANLEAQAQALFRSWFVDFEPFRDGPFVDSELGKIPQGWKVETLSNLATVIKKGITPSNSETYSHYSIPAYDDAHFPEKQSGETIKSGKYIVYNNSILLSKLNPRIKRLWFIKTAEENAICSTEFIPIQTKDTELISFVFYLIDSDIFYQQALSLVNGATGSHQRFHAEDIMQIPFAWNKDAAIDFAQKANYILQKIEDNIRENQTLSALRDTMLPKLMAGEIAIE